MESILQSTKKVLGLESNYNAFDQDVIMHINATFSTLNQLGIGPLEGFFIEDSGPTWSDFADVPLNQLHMIKTYVYLKVRSLFDPPSTSYLIDAMDKQIKEYEWRLSTFREYALPPEPEPEVVP